MRENNPPRNGQVGTHHIDERGRGPKGSHPHRRRCYGSASGTNLYYPGSAGLTLSSLVRLVDLGRFELPTPWLQTMCSPN